MSSRDSVILLSDSEDEVKYLKIYYRGSQDCIEVPMEANGNVLFEDIALLDSKISALFLEKDSLKRLVKPTDGCFKEPKTKWWSFKVFAVLKKESEIILNGNNSDLNHDVHVTYKWNMQIKSETPTTPGSLQTGFERDNPITFLSPSNRITSIKSEPPTTSELRGKNNHELEQPSSSRILTYSQAKLSEILPTLSSNNQFVSADAVNTSFNSIVAVKVPTNAKLSSAYNVKRTKILKYMLCRGNLGHYNDDFGKKYLKRTLVAYPNKETVRLFHYARMSNILLKTLDSNAKDYCELCDCSLTLKHLLCEKHLTVYHEKYNADPPEIPNLFKPEIYKQYIDPSILAGLKISEFKEMEDSPEFSITLQNIPVFQYKYFLINYILRYNLEMSYESTFSIEKLMFLQKNSDNRILQEIFTIKRFNCNSCNKSINGQVGFIKHIFDVYHIQKGLNQEQFDGICKAMSFVEKTPNGFRFLPFPKIDRKRKQSSDVVHEDSKRQKQE
uniref:C2H2-type domain-containing protein n=1 Tax=Panagrolaimus sp. PS1159 TaxID=55785 RepID=A0AC35FF26_9BILA